MFNGVYRGIKWRWRSGAQERVKRVCRSGGKSARFVLKMGLDGQLDGQLGGLTALCMYPSTDKNGGKNGDF